MVRVLSKWGNGGGDGGGECRSAVPLSLLIRTVVLPAPTSPLTAKRVAWEGGGLLKFLDVGLESNILAMHISLCLSVSLSPVSVSCFSLFLSLSCLCLLCVFVSLSLSLSLSLPVSLSLSLPVSLCLSLFFCISVCTINIILYYAMRTTCMHACRYAHWRGYGP